MLETFTDRARRVVVLAEEEARTLGYNYVDTEHILLGLIREGEGVAAQVLVALGGDLNRVRQQVLRRRGGKQAATEGGGPIETNHPQDSLACSFCGKTRRQVYRLIAGPGDLYICDECVELCNEIFEEGREPDPHL